MIRLPPGSKRTYTLLPYTTLGRSLIVLVRQLVGSFIFGLVLLRLGVERFDRRLFLGREIEWLALQFAQTAGRVVGEADRDLDPLPPFGRDRLGRGLQLLRDQPVEKCCVLQPAAIVGLEQVPHDDAAGGDRKSTRLNSSH